MLGEKLGEAYQVADDLRDVLCDASELGKPIGQDAARLRPNAAAQLGVVGAKSAAGGTGEERYRLDSSVPRSVRNCAKLIKAQTALFFPKQLARDAA